MPYRSQAQRAKFHELQKQGKIDPKVVAEFDQASQGLNLPERVKPKAGSLASRAKSRKR